MINSETIQKVWEKGKVAPPNSPNEWRKDDCDAWINRQSYGNRSSSYGWEIDHITPVSHGGSDHISNLRPLQWENNASRQDSRLVCVVTSSGEKNAHLVKK